MTEDKSEETIRSSVTVMVSSMKDAIRFYTDTLGLKLKVNYGDNFAQVEGPGSVISLHPVTQNGPKAGDSESLSIGFTVDDLDRTMNELRAKGVNFSRVSDDGQVRLAFFSDPDGNPLYLSQSK